MPITPIIKSLLDTDLYKLTCLQFIYEHYSDANVEYHYNARGMQEKQDTPILNKEGVEDLRDQIKLLSELRFTDDELAYLANLGYFKPSFIRFLSTFQLDPSVVNIQTTPSGRFLGNLKVTGNILKVQMWEVVLMAMISEIHFSFTTDWDMKGQDEQANSKIMMMNAICAPIGAQWMEFGTRRRRNYAVQDQFLKLASQYSPAEKGNVPNGFIGTSNVHFAMKYNLKCVGSVGHEVLMLTSGIEGVKCTNRVFLDKWQQTYGKNLMIGLTDTFKSKDFWRMPEQYAKALTGVRQDSGEPKVFIDDAIKWFDENSPNDSKTLLFSDGLDLEKCINIVSYMATKPARFHTVFGVGTFFSNLFAKSPAINHVIKLYKVNDTYVVKLSDVDGKETGDKVALAAAKYELYQHEFSKYYR